MENENEILQNELVEEQTAAAEPAKKVPPVEPTKKRNTGKVIAVAVVSTVAVLSLAVFLIGVVLSSMGILAITGSGIILSKNGVTEPAVTEPAVTEPADTQPVPDHSYTADAETAAAKAGEVVATAGTAKLTNGELQLYYESNLLTYQSQYGYYLMYMGIDLSQNLDMQFYDQESGKTWQDVMLDSALQNWHYYNAMMLKGQEENFQMDAEGLEYVAKIDEKLQEIATASGCATIEEMVTTQIAPGATAEGMRNYMLAEHYYLCYVEYLKKQLEPTMEQIEQYFTDNAEALAANNITKESGNVVDIRHVLIKPEGGTTNENGVTVYSEEEWEACRQKAQKLYDEWKNGEATEETFSQLAKDHSADGNASSGGIYTDITKDVNFVTEFKDWMFAEGRKPGDHGLVKTEFGYHIMYLSDQEAQWIDHCRNAYLQEKINAVVTEAMEKYPLVTNYDVVVLSK